MLCGKPLFRKYRECPYEEVVSSDGIWTKHGPVSVALQVEEAAEMQALPAEFGLSQNVPNPFNPRTTLAYQLPEASEVRLTIYTSSGQVVRTLVEGKKEAGWYRVVWDGLDDAGRSVSAGVYLYELKTRDFVKTRKMVLLR